MLNDRELTKLFEEYLEAKKELGSAIDVFQREDDEGNYKKVIEKSDKMSALRVALWVAVDKRREEKGLEPLDKIKEALEG